MSYGSWLIYGAYGHTGKLVAEEAVRRGHRPVLAGRAPEKLAPVAERLDLEPLILDLADTARLQEAVGNFDLVFHAAGPFMQTSGPMVRACLSGGTNYVDIAGEMRVFEELLALDQRARERGIAIVPGVGFNVLASDSLARYVAEQIAHPTHLDIATLWITEGISPGSLKTMIEILPLGSLARREGQLVRISARRGRRQLRLLDGLHTILPVTLGDLATAYRTTGIPNIRTFTVLPEPTATMFSWTEPVFRTLYGFAPVRRLARKWVEMAGVQPEAHARSSEASQVWVMVRSEGGSQRQAWLETPNSYSFTAAAGVRSVERVLAECPQGATTPALAFGADFVLEIPGTRRRDRLEELERLPGSEGREAGFAQPGERRAG